MSLGVGLFSRRVVGLVPGKTSKFGHLVKENLEEAVVESDDEPSLKNDSIFLSEVESVFISSSKLELSIECSRL
jgi:hypothetical protein